MESAAEKCILDLKFLYSICFLRWFKMLQLRISHTTHGTTIISSYCSRKDWEISDRARVIFVTFILHNISGVLPKENRNIKSKKAIFFYSRINVLKLNKLL